MAVTETLYNIKINKGLLWDHNFPEEQYKTEGFFLWYLSRVLNNGNSQDIKSIPLHIIKENLHRLRLSNKIKHFWHWIFDEKPERRVNL
ncbi:MAG: hypothetical protein ABRQ37_20370 [Candidatus Eremiobacterota bacterium]